MNQCLVFIVLQYFEKVIKKKHSNFKAHMQKCIDIMYNNTLGKMIIVIIVCQ